MLMAHLLELIWATSTPGTMRNRSGMQFAPDRAMSSAVITKTAEGVFDIFCSFLETEVTSMFIRSSRFKVVRSCGDAWPAQTSQRTASMLSRKSALCSGVDIHVSYMFEGSSRPIKEGVSLRNQ